MNLQSHFQHTKYIETYFKIIFRAQSENRKKHKKTHPDYVYYERHHILPKSIWPEYEDLKIHPWNGVLLTAREHFICHLLLWKHYKKTNEIKWLRKMSRAFHRMSRIKTVNSAMYERLKSTMTHLISEETKKKISETKKRNNQTIKCEYCGRNFGIGNYKRWHGEKCKHNINIDVPFQRHVSEETKIKISNSSKGRSLTEETKAKMRKPKSKQHRERISAAKKGIPKSEETKIKISNSLKGNHKQPKTKIKCIYCGIECSHGTHSRWHGDNCKLNTLKIK